jgi:hypothetical protein
MNRLTVRHSLRGAAAIKGSGQYNEEKQETP